MGGAKRQETTSLRSSSSRRDSVSPATSATCHNHVKTVNVGCMSGIFHFVSKYHTRRKFLTFGKKQEKQVSSTPKPEKTITCKSHDHQTISSTTPSRLSLEVPRSPAIPPEIRNSTSSNSNSPRVVARLMGLDDIPAPPSPISVAAESASEKRRKLLGALEKCDEDLKALKKIIEAVRVVQTPPRPPPKVAVVDGRGGKGMREKWMETEEEEVESEEPSPVSVLDYHDHNRNYDRHEVLTGSPTFNGYSKRNRNGRVLQHQHNKQQPKQPRQQMIKKKPGEVDYNANFYIMSKSSPDIFTNPPSLYIQSKSRVIHKPLSTPWSAAMKQSVGEVCGDVSRGQSREVVQIGLLIQDFIYKDLIEEIIKDMGCNFDRVYSFPRKLRFDACKRKLSF